MSDREPVLKDCFKVKKGLCVTGNASITGNLTLSGDFGWMNPDALLTVGNINTTNLSAGTLYSSNHEFVDVPLGLDYTIIHPISVVDETIFESNLQVEENVIIKGDLSVDGDTYFSTGAAGSINIGNTDTDVVNFVAKVGSDIIPSDVNTYNLGTSALYWNTLYVHDISAHGSVEIEENLDVTGDTTLDGTFSAIGSSVFDNNVHIKGDLRVDGNAYLSAGSGGSINIGDTSTDNIVFVADVSSNIIPDESNKYDLGSPTQEWRELYVQDISGSQDLSIDRYVNFSGLSSGELSGKFISYQPDGEITTSTLIVDEVSRATTKVNNTSAEWDSVYSWVNSDSATNNSDYNQTAYVNASGDAMTGDLNMGSKKLITTRVQTGDDSKILTLLGGSDSSDGAQIMLVGADHPTANIRNRVQINADDVIIGDVFDTNYQPWVLHVDVDNKQVMLGGLSPLNNSDISLYGHTTVSGDMLPNSDVDFDLGSNSHQWNTLFTQDISASNAVSASNLIVTGMSTLSSLSLSADSTTPVLRVSQLGSGNAVEVVDTTDPDDSPFVIDATGKVGIGVTVPSAKLHVDGVSRFSRASTGSQPSIVTIENTATGTTANQALEVIGDMTATGSISAAGDIYAANNSLIFSDGNSGNDETWSKQDAIDAKRVRGQWDNIHHDGSLIIPVSSTVAGDFTAKGDVILGQPNTVITLGQIGSDITPKIDGGYVLGAPGAAWKSIESEEITTGTIQTVSISGGSLYFAPIESSGLDINPVGASPSAYSSDPYEPERVLTYQDIVSARDTTSVVQSNSAYWAEQVQTIRTGSLNLTFNTTNGSGTVYHSEFLPIATDNPAGDARWDDITYAHAMVLPFKTVVSKVILRATASQGATVKVNIHSNHGVTNMNTLDYKYFPETPIASAENSFQYNNESKVFTFADTTSATVGETLGISISGDKVISTTNVSIVLRYIE